VGRLRAKRRRLRDSGACRIAPVTVPLARRVRHSSTPAHSPARRPRASVGHEVRRAVRVCHGRVTSRSVGQGRWPGWSGRQWAHDGLRNRAANVARRCLRMTGLAGDGDDGPDCIGTKCQCGARVGEGVRLFRPYRGLSTSPCPLAGFALLGCRAELWESKPENGHWGRSTGERKRNHGPIWRRWKPRAPRVSLAFFPLAGGGTLPPAPSALSLSARSALISLLHDWTQNGAPVFFGYFEVHVATPVLAAELLARGA